MMCLCLVMSGEHASRLGRTQRRLSTGCHKAADTPPRRAHAPVHGSGALWEHMHPVPSVEASLCRLHPLLLQPGTSLYRKDLQRAPC